MVTTRRQKNNSISDLYGTILNAYTYLQKFNSMINQAKAIINKNPCVISTRVESLLDLNQSIDKKELADGAFSGMSDLLDSFRDDNGTLPIHWASKLGLTKIVEELLSKNPALLFERTGTRNKLPLHFVGKHDDAKHALVSSHPDFDHLSMIYEECCEEPMDVAETLERAICFDEQDIVLMFIEARPEEVQEYLNFHRRGLEWEEQDECLLLLTEFDPTLAHNHSGPLPLFRIMNPYGYYDDNDWSEEGSYILRFLSSSLFYGLFEPVQVTIGTDTPQWEKNDTHWAHMLDHSIFPDRLASNIFRIAAEKQYPLLNGAVGKLSIDDVLYLMTAYDIDTDEQIDDQRRNLLVVCIHRASEPINIGHWQRYFRVLVFVAFLRQCNLNTEETRKLLGVLNHDDHDVYDQLVSGKQNKHGQYLIHILAKEHLASRCIVDFIDSNPDDLMKLDSESGLLPFMMSGVGDKGSLSSTYELFRKRPDVLEMVRNKYDEQLITDTNMSDTFTSAIFSFHSSCDERNQKRQRQSEAVIKV